MEWNICSRLFSPFQCVRGYLWRPEVNHQWHSSGTTCLGNFFETESLTGVEFAKWSWLTGQGVLGIHQSLPPPLLFCFLNVHLGYLWNSDLHAFEVNTLPTNPCCKLLKWSNDSRKKEARPCKKTRIHFTTTHNKNTDTSKLFFGECINSSLRGTETINDWLQKHYFSFSIFRSYTKQNRKEEERK